MSSLEKDARLRDGSKRRHLKPSLASRILPKKEEIAVLMLKSRESGSSIQSTTTVASALQRLILFTAVAAWAVFGADLCMAAGDHGTTPPVRQASLENATASGTNEAWRFRFHDGRWWYWLPSNSWAWHDGHRWNAYQAEKPRRVSTILVQRQARSNSPERYQSGTAPTPPPSIEQLRDNIEQLQQTVRQLESRLVEDERANGARRSQVQPLNVSDEAKLQTLWRAQQDAVSFYDFNSDAYYFQGKGHFTD